MEGTDSKSKKLRKKAPAEISLNEWGAVECSGDYIRFFPEGQNLLEKYITTPYQGVDNLGLESCVTESGFITNNTESVLGLLKNSEQKYNSDEIAYKFMEDILKFRWGLNYLKDCLYTGPGTGIEIDGVKSFKQKMILEHYPSYEKELNGKKRYNQVYKELTMLKRPMACFVPRGSIGTVGMIDVLYADRLNKPELIDKPIMYKQKNSSAGMMLDIKKEDYLLGKSLGNSYPFFIKKYASGEDMMDELKNLKLAQELLKGTPLPIVFFAKNVEMEKFQKQYEEKHMHKMDLPKKEDSAITAKKKINVIKEEYSKFVSENIYFSNFYVYNLTKYMLNGENFKEGWFSRLAKKEVNISSLTPEERVKYRQDFMKWSSTNIFSGSEIVDYVSQEFGPKTKEIIKEKTEKYLFDSFSPGVYLVEEFIDGKTLEQLVIQNSKKTKYLLRETASKLAELHAKSTKNRLNINQYDEVLQKRPNKGHKEKTLDYIINFLDDEGVDGEDREKAIELVNNMSIDEVCAVHGGIHGANILYAPHERINLLRKEQKAGVYFLDWEHMGYGNPYIDLSRVLVSLEIMSYQKNEDLSNLQKLFLKEYAKQSKKFLMGKQGRIVADWWPKVYTDEKQLKVYMLRELVNMLNPDKRGSSLSEECADKCRKKIFEILEVEKPESEDVTVPVVVEA